jgi:hypothetical protein
MIMICEQSTPIAFIRAECMDLWRDECGWSANCSWVRRRTVVVPTTASDKTVSRRIKKALGIQGMPVDSWAGSDYCWRDGCVGAYADWIV